MNIQRLGLKQNFSMSNAFLTRKTLSSDKKNVVHGKMGSSPSSAKNAVDILKLCFNPERWIFIQLLGNYTFLTGLQHMYARDVDPLNNYILELYFIIIQIDTLNSGVKKFYKMFLVEKM